MHTSSPCVSYHLLIIYSSDHLLRLTVLNPMVRFTWIQDEWDKDYIYQAKETILDCVSTIYCCLLYLSGFL